ncbi:MAG: type II secretion system protein [Candidatus Doudnabacteria bacterium]|nr:type II secretion system protein [Candidatus Doudnabacteria bacterium]
MPYVKERLSSRAAGLERKKNASGFTLIELLVVIAILGLLASVVLVSTNSARIKARDAKRAADFSQLSKALELYYSNHNQYPTLTVSIDNCWVDNSCDSKMDINWTGMINALRSDKVLAEEKFESFPDDGFMFTEKVKAAGAAIQDPRYPAQRYGYMVSATPLNQNYRMRAMLEELKNPILNSGVKGSFMFYDENETTDPSVSCSPAIGYYCVGPSSSSFTTFYPGKPVIYLYPTYAQNVTVKVFPKTITDSVPAYGDGWKVFAHPNGRLTNLSDGQTYPYLFWDGISGKPTVNTNKGFVVKEADIKSFLADSLKKQGLIENEANEFIEYWAPLMSGKPYVYVYFMPQPDYDKLVPMEIEPKPETLIRVYMLFKKLETYVEVQPQEFNPPKRRGFTAVEWGGDRSQLR